MKQAKNTTPWYRFRLWLLRYLRRRDFLWALTAWLTIYLVISAYQAHPRLSLLVGGVYVVLFTALATDILKGRKARDYTQAEVLNEFFARLNREVFNDDPKTRITLFRQNPFNQDYIVPWYRYTKNCNSLVAEAQKSRACFQKGEGFTGYTWESGDKDLICVSMPPFKNEEEFRKFYVDHLKIDPRRINCISSFMTSVQGILSFRFSGQSEEFLGVLSIDVQKPLEFVEGGEEELIPKLGDEDFDIDSLVEFIYSIEVVLEAFAKTGRGNL